MTQSSCKRDTKSKSHLSVKLAPVRVLSCKRPLRLSLDSGDGFRTGCRNVKVCYSSVQLFSYCLAVRISGNFSLTIAGISRLLAA